MCFAIFSDLKSKIILVAQNSQKPYLSASPEKILEKIDNGALKFSNFSLVQ